MLLAAVVIGVIAAAEETPADKKTAINAVKKPMETIFLNFKILFINYFNY